MLGLRYLIALPAVALLLMACGQMPDQINNSGHDPYASGDYASALEAYESARSSVPMAAEPHYNIGNALYRAGQFEGSINDYDESLRYAKNDLRSRGFFNRGNAAFQMQQYLQAVEGYKEVLRMNPDDLDAKHNLELALRQLPPEAQNPQNEPPPPQDEPPPPQNEPPPPQDEPPPPQNEPPPPQDEPPPPQVEPPPQAEPPPPSQPLTQEQANQTLEAVGNDAQTLQERRQQTLVAPEPPTEFDW